MIGDIFICKCGICRWHCTHHRLNECGGYKYDYSRIDVDDVIVITNPDGFVTYTVLQGDGAWGPLLWEDPVVTARIHAKVAKWA